MALELLTPFTKVELETQVKDHNRKQIGILGGNFNPVHNAHLVVADQVRQQLGLDQVLLMPSSTFVNGVNSSSAIVPPHIRMIYLIIALTFCDNLRFCFLLDSL